MAQSIRPTSQSQWVQKTKRGFRESYEIREVLIHFIFNMFTRCEEEYSNTKVW